MRKLLIPLLLILSFNLSALLEVSVYGGFTPYIEIQAAINAAAVNDTVLVYPGIYYENLDFSYKSNVNLISLEAIRHDSIYISQTIINGSHEESTVILLNGADSNFLIRGFTITGGTGLKDANSPPTHGGGIVANLGHLSLINSVVEYNCADKGGGISVAKTGSLTLSGTIIRNNVAYYGGGGMYLYSSPTLQPEMVFDSVNRSSIYDNYSRWGTDIYWLNHHLENCELYLDKFTVANPDKYYIGNMSNYAAFYTSPEHSPFGLIDIQQGVHQQVDADLYVANEGDDTNSGLSPEEPLRTTYRAFQILNCGQENPRTVHIAAGEYQSVVHGFTDVPIGVKSYTTLTGVSPEETKIMIEGKMNYGEVGLINCVTLPSQDVIIKNLTLTNTHGSVISTLMVSNLILENIIIEDCYGVFDPVLSIKSNLQDKIVKLKDVTIRNNTTDGWHPTTGSIGASEVLFDNVKISDNDNIFEYEGVIAILEIVVTEKLVVTNSQFTNNTSRTVSSGGSQFRFMGFGDEENPEVIFDNFLFTNNYSRGQAGRNFTIHGESIIINNSTFANNTSSDYYTVNIGAYSYSKVYNTIIADNSHIWALRYYNQTEVDNCLFSNLNAVFWSNGDILAEIGENNLYDADPLFTGNYPENPAYYMLANDEINGCSPAIDAGSEDFSFFPEWYESLTVDLAGQPRIYGDRVDIGCYEYQGPTGNNDSEAIMNQLSAINYPNPFNPETTIEFNNPKQGEVTVDIYNLKGQLVKKLLQANLEDGSHKTVWNGTDNQNKPVSSGVYFYRINSADKLAITKKIILLK